MTRRLIRLLFLLVSVSLPARAAEIIACGGSQVVIFDADQPEGENPTLKWNWDVKEATNLPPRYQKLLVPLDECKPVRNNTQVLLTSVFHISRESFAPFSLLANVENVKSVNYDPHTRHLVYTKAEISWWTHHIYCRNPDKTFTFPGINLYKARVASP